MVSAPAAKHVQQHRVSYQDLTSEPTAMMKLDRPKASKQSSPTLPRNPLSSLPTGKHPFSSATAVESTLARYPTTFIECKTILPFSPGIIVLPFQSIYHTNSLYASWPVFQYWCIFFTVQVNHQAEQQG